MEESLWDVKTRFDFSYMNSILTDDFFEFGRSGRVYKREDLLDTEIEAFCAKLPLINFSIHFINLNVVLITYVTEVGDKKVEKANRSSIWVKKEGKWQLRFHQGTPF